MNEVIVYQVRTIDAHGNVRVIHAYETEDAAKRAIEVMRKHAPARYTYVAVPNQPNAHWGINFPAIPTPGKLIKHKPYGITELPTKTQPKAS